MAAYFAEEKHGFTPRRRERISASARSKLGMGLQRALTGPPQYGEKPQQRWRLNVGFAKKLQFGSHSR
jgi:hypothetical protein